MSTQHPRGTKLRVFDLDDLDKVVFLDADTVVLRNVDELFERPAITAAPDFFMPDRFNSGVMVIEPSHELFGTLHASLVAAPTYDGGDQGVLNAYWTNWWSMPVGHRLEARYSLATSSSSSWPRIRACAGNSSTRSGSSTTRCRNGGRGSRRPAAPSSGGTRTPARIPRRRVSFGGACTRSRTGPSTAS